MEGLEVQRVDVMRFDAPVIGDDGFAHIPATLTRTGVFPYMNRDGSIRMELRHPDDVMDADSIESMRRKPVVLGHPSFGAVTADNARSVSVGFTGDDVSQNEGQLDGTVTLIDSHAIDLVTREQNPHRELSAGYHAVVTKETGSFNGQRYDSRQRKIRYNHLAILDRGRMGKDVRLKVDHDCAVYIQDSLEANIHIDFVQDEHGGPVAMPTKHKQPSHKFKSLKLDSATITVGDDSEQAFLVMQQREDALVGYAATSDSRYDKLEGEKDALVKQVSEQTARADEAEKRPKVTDIGALVAERSKLIQVADGLKIEVGDDHSNMDIMRKVILKVDSLKDDALEEKTDEYIQARYDGTKVDLARTQQGMKLLADAGGVGAEGNREVAPRKSKRDIYMDHRFGRTEPETKEAAANA